MGNYLLDTHALLWYNEDDPQLSPEAKTIINNAENMLFVSIVSFWEIVIKQSIGKLKLEYSLELLAALCIETSIQILPIQLYHLNQLSLLPAFHKDPFDRLIVATAISESIMLISKDNQMKGYMTEVIW